MTRALPVTAGAWPVLLLVVVITFFILILLIILVLLVCRGSAPAPWS